MPSSSVVVDPGPAPEGIDLTKFSAAWGQVQIGENTFRTFCVFNGFVGFPDNGESIDFQSFLARFNTPEFFKVGKTIHITVKS
jgi:hypothetical protein